jgi:hypothetical protein
VSEDNSGFLIRTTVPEACRMVVKRSQTAQGHAGEQLHVRGLRMEMRVWENVPRGYHFAPHDCAVDIAGYITKGSGLWLIDGQEYIDETRFRRINTPVDVWQVSATRMADNFMDIAHLPWVHAGTIGRAQNTCVPPLTLEQLDDTFYGYRYTIDANNPDAARVTSGSQAPVVTRWMTTGFALPFTTRSMIRFATGLEHILLLLTTPIDDVTKLATTSWLFVIFGESQLAVRDLTDWIACRPCSEPRFPDTCSSKMVNFYPDTRAYDPVRGGALHAQPMSPKATISQHPLLWWGMKPTVSWPPTCNPSCHD